MATEQIQQQMKKQALIAVLLLLKAVFATQCQKFKFANMTTNTCDECHPLCNSGWCKGSSIGDCLVCTNPKQYRDFSSWKCLDSCSIVSKQTVEVYTKLISGDGIFKYCLETDFYIDSYDLNNIIQPSLELGTKLLPFRSLDDAFRTIFNYNYNDDSTSQFLINIKHGSNLTLNSEDMPLIVLNSNVEIRPYSDDPNIDMKVNLTQIKIYHRGYDRPNQMNGFNPSFSDVNQIIEYNITDKISQELVDQESINNQKYKFVILNSNFKIQQVNFTEITSQQDETNTLFRMYYGEYITLVLDYCFFNLNWLLAMTQEGVNFRLLNSIINIENTVNIIRYGAKNECSLYDKYWIANNFLIDNCTFQGIAIIQGLESYNYLFSSVNPVNITVQNSQFLNVQWIDSWNELFPLKCASPIYTRFVFENNTFQNFDESPVAHISFQMILNEDNIQEAYLINNKFINIQYIKPIFKGTKTGGKGFKVFLINNYFERIVNVRGASNVVSFQAEQIIINNITIKNSVISSFASFQNQRSIIQNIEFFNVSRMNQNLAPSLSHAFLTQILSKDSIMSSIYFHNCDFSLSRAINIIQSSKVTIENLHFINSQANNNNLIYISLSKDLTFRNLTVNNITKNSPGMVALFNVFQLQSWGQNDNIMKYIIEKLNFSQSSISILNIETYQPLQQESAIIISFQNITIENIKIQGKEALFQFNPTNQTSIMIKLAKVSSDFQQQPFSRCSHQRQSLISQKAIEIDGSYASVSQFGTRVHD